MKVQAALHNPIDIATTLLLAAIGIAQGLFDQRSSQARSGIKGDSPQASLEMTTRHGSNSLRKYRQSG